MSFTAKFRSECPDCGETIRRGDEVEFNSADEVTHVICPDVDTRPADRVCPECFTELPVTGVCGVCE